MDVCFDYWPQSLEEKGKTMTMVREREACRTDTKLARSTLIANKRRKNAKGEVLKN